MRLCERQRCCLLSHFCSPQHPFGGIHLQAGSWVQVADLTGPWQRAANITCPCNSPDHQSLPGRVISGILLPSAVQGTMFSQPPPPQPHPPHTQNRDRRSTVGYVWWSEGTLGNFQRVDHKRRGKWVVHGSPTKSIVTYSLNWTVMKLRSEFKFPLLKFPCLILFVFPSMYVNVYKPNF